MDISKDDPTCNEITKGKIFEKIRCVRQFTSQYQKMADRKDLEQIVIDSCETITGIRPKSMLHVKLELLNFIKLKEADWMIVDEEDLPYLFEVAATLNGQKTSDLITEDLLSVITKKDTSKGNRMPVKGNDEIKNLVNMITVAHPDISFEMKKSRYWISHEKCFMELINFKYGSDASDFNLVHCTVRLKFVKTMDELIAICPKEYLHRKNWSIQVHERKNVAMSDGWTRHQIAELLENRKIINYGR